MIGNLLATGGLTAAAVAAWSQIRATASYLTSYVVVTAHMQGISAYTVRRHLKRHAKPLPSGVLHYVDRYFPWVQGMPGGFSVPFRIMPATVVFMHGYWPVLATFEGHKCTLRALRGTINFDDLVTASYQAHQSSFPKDKQVTSFSGFMVRQIRGAAKGLATVTVPNGGMESGPSGSKNPINDPSDLLDDDIDKPIGMARGTFGHMPPICKSVFVNLYYDDAVMGHVEQARRWLAMGEWYAERSIPWRRGWLLVGEPGTGKSSLALALAQELNLPLFNFMLSTMSDDEFLSEWNEISGIQGARIVLFEDFDAVFHGRTPVTQHKSLNFDTVLNALSGVSSKRGTLVIITTNELDKIDPAIGCEAGEDGMVTRPGRIDAIIRLGAMTLAHRCAMADHILRDWPQAAYRMPSRGAGMTPAQFQELCVREAFELIQADESADQRMAERKEAA